VSRAWVGGGDAGSASWVGQVEVVAKSDKTIVNQDFAAATEVELDGLMRVFKEAHEAETGQRLAIDGKRSLGPGKVRVAFRVVATADPKKKGKR